MDTLTFTNLENGITDAINTEKNMFNPNAETDFEQIPEGVYLARCARVIELGTQYSEKFDTSSNKAQIVLSLPGHTVNIGGEDKQAFISNAFGITMSNNKKGNMKQYTRALDPNSQATNIGYFLDQPCQVSIVHSEKGKAIIDSVSPVLPGTEVPALDTDPFWFSWEKPDPAVWSQLPEFTRNMIREATNFKGSLVEAMVNDLEGAASDVPM